MILRNTLLYASELERHPIKEHVENSVGVFAARCIPEFWLARHVVGQYSKSAFFRGDGNKLSVCCLFFFCFFSGNS